MTFHKPKTARKKNTQKVASGYAAPVMVSSKIIHWNTPEKVLERVRLLDMHGVGLDPCANKTSSVRAHTEYHEEDDGLSHDWRGHGLVYMNPPYGKALLTWCGKMWEEFRLASDGGARDQIVALVPARPDTQWWHRFCAPADAVCFIEGRLKFQGAPAVAPFPSALIYYGAKRHIFKAHFQDLGWIP